MATERRRRIARTPDPKDRWDDFVFSITDATRRWSRSARWDNGGRNMLGFQSSDQLDLAGAVRHRNRLAFERLQLTLYSNEPGSDEGQYFGICNRVRGDRALLSATVWLPLPELMQLAPDLVAGRFVELELRVKGLFRSRGSVPGITFNTRATPDDELPAD